MKATRMKRFLSLMLAYCLLMACPILSPAIAASPVPVVSPSVPCTIIDSIVLGHENQYFFEVAIDGVYTVFTEGEETDTYGRLYDASGNLLYEHFDTFKDFPDLERWHYDWSEYRTGLVYDINFKFTIYLTAGQIYEVVVGGENTLNAGTYTLTISYLCAPLPTSGSELAYNPDPWNNNDQNCGDNYKDYSNCIGYM